MNLIVSVARVYIDGEYAEPPMEELPPVPQPEDYRQSCVIF